jgi:hypothetical protein
LDDPILSEVLQFQCVLLEEHVNVVEVEAISFFLVQEEYLQIFIYINYLALLAYIMIGPVDYVLDDELDLLV